MLIVFDVIEQKLLRNFVPFLAAIIRNKVANLFGFTEIMRKFAA